MRRFQLSLAIGANFLHGSMPLTVSGQYSQNTEPECFLYYLENISLRSDNADRKSMTKRLIVDMDGVLANVYEQFIHFEFAETGRKIALEETMGLAEWQAFPNGPRHVRQQGFFREAPVMPSAVAVLKELNQKYDLFIVSSAMEFPTSLQEKYYWMEEHFPFISWKQLVLCGSKTVIRGDFMIDDHFKNLDHFEGKTFLFTQPHNYGHSEKSHHRVNSWDEIAAIL